MSGKREQLGVLTADPQMTQSMNGDGAEALSRRAGMVVRVGLEG